jgi:small subunit ribosomal protein S5
MADFKRPPSAGQGGNRGGRPGSNTPGGENNQDRGRGRGNNRDNDRGRQEQAQPESEFKDKLVALNRVAKVTKGGRTFTFAAIVVVGDGKGQVGQGLGKAREVSEAIAKATDDAKKNLVKVAILKGTIPHEQKGRFDAGRVFLKPAAHGTGVIAGGAMRAVLESAGIHDVLAKSMGSSNPHNVVKATIDALVKLRDPRTVAKQRGLTLTELFK